MTKSFLRLCVFAPLRWAFPLSARPTAKIPNAKRLDPPVPTPGAAEQPPESPVAPPPAPGATHFPDGSHTFGERQSLIELHALRHAPLAQTYGVQSVRLFDGSIDVCPSHVDPEMHLPETQWSPGVQSESALQLALHAVAPQTYGAHGLVVGAGHPPVPSQLAACVSIPPAQLEARHDTELPTKPAHCVRALPSQTAAAHAPASPPLEHAGRDPTGAPETGAHVPSTPATLHASH
jgi:hypothetical protein